MNAPLRLAVAGLALAAVPAVAQPVVRWADPALLNGSPVTLCTDRGDARVCRTPNDEGAFDFTLWRDGREIGAWTGGGWLHGGFRVFEGDLDRDGRTELVVANTDAVSNGLGVTFWTLYVLDAAGGAPVLRVASQDFGEGGGSFARDARGRTVLTVTEWMEDANAAGRPGMYLVGRPFRYEGGRLVPAADRPVRARRLLNAFAAERARTGATGGAPGTWLARGETRRRDPYLRGPEAGVERGTVRTVTRVEMPEGPPRWRITVVRTGGDPVEVVYGDHPYDAERGVHHLGDATSGRLLPAGYVAADVAAWLVGRHVRLAAHGAGPDGEPRRVLWLE